MSTLLLKDARAPIAKMLHMTVSDARIIQYINEAVEVAVLTHDWVNMERPMSFLAYNGAVTFPPEVVAPIKFSVAGVRGRPFGLHYEYLLSGPGSSEDWNYVANNLVDAGYVPTAYDCDEDNPAKLCIWSDMVEDEPFEVWIRGLDENGREVRTSGSIGETISITGEANAMHLTEHTFSRITQIVKPAGSGYLHINTADSEGSPDRVVSSLHPDETSPSYRRFLLHGVPDQDVDGFVVIKGIFRIGYRPVIRENDPIAISIIHALKLMVKSIWHQEHGEPNKAAILEGQAERILTNQRAQADIEDGLLDSDESHDMSDVGLM